MTGFPELLGRPREDAPSAHPRGDPRPAERRRGRRAHSPSTAIEPFDLVCVNLYPFELAVDRPELDEAEAHRDDRRRRARRCCAQRRRTSRRCTVVARPEDYDEVLGELRAGQGDADSRDSATSRGDGVRDDRPPTRRRSRAGSSARRSSRRRSFRRSTGCASSPYGENPHQRAAYYAERGARTHLLAFVEQLQGKALSFNNLGDLSAARLLAARVRPPGVRHREAREPVRGRRRGRRSRRRTRRRSRPIPVSAYGGVVVVNRAVSARARRGAREQFVEVLFAPAYDEQALEVARTQGGAARPEHTERRGSGRRRARLPARAGRSPRPGSRLGRSATGRTWRSSCGEVSDEQWDDLLFAWRVVKHVTSNAIVLARRRPDARDRRGSDEPRGRGAHRDREGTRARPLARGRGARLGRVLPVRRRAAARARRRGRRRRSSPAGRSATPR